MNREKVIELMTSIGAGPNDRCPQNHARWINKFRRFAELIEAEAKEECARLIENEEIYEDAESIWQFADRCAQAIRATISRPTAPESKHE